MTTILTRRRIYCGISEQGKAFPYSFGLHIVVQLVAVFHPHNLDAMDKSVTLKKKVFGDLLRRKLGKDRGRRCDSGHSMAAEDQRLAARAGPWN